MNFVAAVAYQFCLNFPATFSQLGNGIIVKLCTCSQRNCLSFIESCKVIRAWFNIPSDLQPTDQGSQCTAHKPKPAVYVPVHTYYCWYILTLSTLTVENINNTAKVKIHRLTDMSPLSASKKSMLGGGAGGSGHAVVATDDVAPSSTSSSFSAKQKWLSQRLRKSNFTSTVPNEVFIPRVSPCVVLRLNLAVVAALLLGRGRRGLWIEETDELPLLPMVFLICSEILERV